MKNSKRVSTVSSSLNKEAKGTTKLMNFMNTSICKN